MCGGRDLPRCFGEDNGALRIDPLPSCGNKAIPKRTPLSDVGKYSHWFPVLDF